MTSAAYKPAGAAGRHAERRGYGVVIFAGRAAGGHWGLCACGGHENIEAAS